MKPIRNSQLNQATHKGWGLYLPWPKSAESSVTVFFLPEFRDAASGAPTSGDRYESIAKRLSTDATQN